MTDKNGKPEQPNFDDEEFNFSEEEFGSEEHEPESETTAADVKPAKKKKFLSRKTIIGGIVGIVAIIAIFQFLTQQEKSAQPELPVVEQSPTATTLTPPPTPSRAAVTLPTTTSAPSTVITTNVRPPANVLPSPVTSTTTLTPPATMRAIPTPTVLPVTTPQSLTVTTTSTNAMPAANANEVGQAILELRNGFANLTQQFQAMSSQVQEMICNPSGFCQQARILPIVKEKTYVGKKRSHKKAAKPLVYHVKALIPGRAWLESNRGTTTSVKVGDTLKNYGQIISINRNTGMVDTSSGRVIKYGRYDS